MSSIEKIQSQLQQLDVQGLNALMAKRQEGQSAIAHVEALPCNTPEEEQTCSHLLTMTRDIVKELEAQRTAITKPLLDAKRGIDNLFRPARQPWEHIESVIRSKIQVFRQARLEAEQAAKEAAYALAAQGQTEQVTEVLATVPVRHETVGIGEGREWTFGVKDKTLVPEEFKAVDHSAVKIWLKQYKNSEVVPEIPGLVFRRVATVRAR